MERFGRVCPKTPRESNGIRRLLRVAGRAILLCMAASMEIRCKACNRLTLVRAEPVYEDFKKVSESFVCTACGHRYPSREKTPFVDPDGRPRVFSEADRPEVVKVFKSDERRRSCAWCRLFIVNPFSQRCGLNNREVQATDVCARFTPKPEPSTDAGKSSATSASSRFDALFAKETPAAAPVIPPPPPVVFAPPPEPAVKAATVEPQPEPETQTAAAKSSPAPKVKKAATKPKATPAEKKPVGRPRKKTA